MKYPDILSIESEPIVSTYTVQDTILYALGVGMGADPLDPRELSFVYEKNLRTVPTMGVIIGKGSDKILREGGVNFRMMLHGEQRLRVHKTLPPEGRIAISSRCASVVDKGAGKGALLNMERSVTDASSGELYVTTISTLFCRGDGGFGGPTESTYITHEIPARPHDKEVAVKTRPDQACIYRLSGDLTGLHIDPEAAKLSGFDRPILHGLCTYGLACRAVMLGMCDLDPTKISTFDARFSSPVFPGETIITRLWKDGSTVSFECSVAERGVVVLRNGRCDLFA